MNKNLLNEEFKILKSFVYNGDYEEIDKFFLNKDKKYLENIGNMIINDSYFFIFKTDFFIINAEVIKKEQIKRHCSILKNLLLKEQINLFFEMQNEFDIEHLNCLKIENTKKCVNFLKNNNTFCYILSKMFNLEKFNLIDLIQEKVKYDILNEYYNCSITIYKEKYSHGSFSIPLEEKIFKPYFDILFNFTLQTVRHRPLGR